MQNVAEIGFTPAPPNKIAIWINSAKHKQPLTAVRALKPLHVLGIVKIF